MIDTVPPEFIPFTEIHVMEAAPLMATTLPFSIYIFNIFLSIRPWTITSYGTIQDYHERAVIRKRKLGFVCRRRFPEPLPAFPPGMSDILL